MIYSKIDNNSESQRGIALIMVLWVLTILMVIVISFSYITRKETDAALSFRKGAVRKFLAEAGIQRGIMELFYRKDNLSFGDSEAWRTDGTLYRVETSAGDFTVRITEESGKVDINRSPDVILRGLFGSIGLEEGDIDIVVDSIMDWKDIDDLHRLHGVESDYYMSLPNPYRAKDADFDTIEELIMVRGITPEMLYRDDEKIGVIDLLTVNSKTGKISLNSAPWEVLAAIPGISAETADALIKYREISEIRSIQEILGPDYSLAMPYISLSGGRIFTIDAAGFAGSEDAGYGIRATVSIEGNSSYRYLYYKSPAGVKRNTSRNSEEF